MNTICPICFNEIKNDNSESTFRKKEKIKKELTCGHYLHFCCYRKLVYHKSNFFIKCPLCRIQNFNIIKPYQNDIDNLSILCSLNKRCNHTTKKRLKCKNNSKLLNYGYCHIHNKDFLLEKKYNLMNKFIYLILCQRNNIFVRLQLIDLGKKIIINYSNDNDDIDNVMYYFYKFLNVKNYIKINDYSEMYDFYHFQKPEPKWLRDCIKHSILY